MTGLAAPNVTGLHRTRLLDQLVGRSRFTLLLGPAGTGKTTLAKQHVSSCRELVIWHRADRTDVDVESFGSRLVAAVGSAQPQAPAVDVCEALRGLGDRRVTIVVDDAQALIGTAAETLLERILVDGPTGLSIIMASRREPRLNVARAEIGSLTVITADDLRFRSWETEQLFRDVYHEPLPPDDIAMLTRRTEGWAAGLQLFHLSTLSRPLAERRGAVSALSGRSRFARTYLVRTVLDGIPSDLRVFLAGTAVFEMLTAKRCNALLGRTDTQRDLEELERLAAFTTSDDGGRTFRYHEVLRSHLESVLHDDLGADATRQWFARAAAILEAESASSEAVRAYVRAERWDDAARLLRDDGARVIAANRGTGWHDMLPTRMVEEDPWLSLAVGRRLALEGRLSAAIARYQHAEALFPERTDRERAVRERRLVELWVGGSPRPQPLLHWLDRVRLAVQRRPGDAALSRADATAGAGDRLARAVATLLTGDVAATRNRLAGTEQNAESELALAVRLLQGLVDLLIGVHPTEPADRLAADAERAGVAWVARQARLLGGLHDRRPNDIFGVAGECASAGDTWGRLLADAAGATLRLVAGKSSQAAWDQVTRQCRALGASTLAAWAAAARALAAAAERDPRAVAMARAAERNGRAVGAWGAQALAVLALAVADPRDRDRTLQEAHRMATAHGMPWPESLANRLLEAAGDRPSAPARIEPRDPVVTMRCFGGFLLEVDGHQLDWTVLRPRAATALRLLAAHVPEPVHRDTLLTLWPGSAPPAATHSLQVAISSVRGFLTPGVQRGEHRLIRRRDEAYLLALPPGSVADVADFRNALREAAAARRSDDPQAERIALAAAVDAYTGDLLPDDGPAEWVVDLRERLRIDAALSAGRLAELAFAAGDLPGGVEAVRRSVQIDRYCDSSWRLLISAYTRTGDLAAASRARQDYHGVLADLGIPSIGSGRRPLDPKLDGQVGGAHVPKRALHRASIHGVGIDRPDDDHQTG